MLAWHRRPDVDIGSDFAPARASGAQRTIQLDDRLTGVDQVPGQAGTIAT